MTGLTRCTRLVRMSRLGPASVTIAALVLGVAIVGSVTTEVDPLVASGPGPNGLIAYSYDGDIHVGDPVTGETARITKDPRYEVNPVFSPNGRRIAFIRGDPQTGDSTIVVVQADGSDERVLLPKGREHRGFGVLAWTPDGSSLVAQLDRPPFTFPYGDGELSLFDASGTGEERLLAPPLPLSIGGHYFSTDHQVAPMFRPPAGDMIASAEWNAVRISDATLTTGTRLGEDLLRPYKPFNAGAPSWSPDGARIAFGLDFFLSGGGYRGGGSFVMSAEGDELRRIRGLGQWSPDSSRMAFERVRPKTDRAVLVVLDLESGDERSLESTSAAGKDAGARFRTLTYNNVVHHWYYEGWKWAPDGRKLLVLENHRTRPWLVDIETDTVTQLPWLADSMPSWQRVTG
jgi:WD40 repeat protein